MLNTRKVVYYCIKTIP